MTRLKYEDVFFPDFNILRSQVKKLNPDNFLERIQDTGESSENLKLPFWMTAANKASDAEKKII